MSSKESKLLAALKAIWRSTIGLTKIEVFKILKSDVNEYNSITVSQILSQAQISISDIHESITKLRARSILKFKIDLTSPAFSPLRALLSERRFLLNKVFSSYKFILDESAKKMLDFKKTQAYLDFIRIGRRGQDRVRQITLRSLERTFLTGNPVTLGKHEIIDSILGDPTIRKLAQPDGTFRFPLHLYPYEQGSAAKFANWDVEQYAEMTARTTAHLADQESFIVDADEPDEVSGFLKFNNTGKSRGQYLKENDPKCAAINNNVFATKPIEVDKSGKRGARGASGKFYQYIRDVLRGFAIAHPNCNHIGKPIPVEVV